MKIPMTQTAPPPPPPESLPVDSAQDSGDQDLGQDSGPPDSNDGASWYNGKVGMRLDSDPFEDSAAEAEAAEDAARLDDAADADAEAAAMDCRSSAIMGQQRG